MVEVQLKKYVISESVTFAVSKRKDIGFTLDYQHHESGSSAGHGQVRILLVKFVVHFEERLVHKDLYHLVQISSFIEHRSPPFYLLNNMVSDVFHTLRTSVTIKNGEKTDEFPLAASYIFLNHEPIFHIWSIAHVQTCTTVESPKFEKQIPDFQLTVE